MNNVQNAKTKSWFPGSYAFARENANRIMPLLNRLKAKFMSETSHDKTGMHGWCQCASAYVCVISQLQATPYTSNSGLVFLFTPWNNLFILIGLN